MEHCPTCKNSGDCPVCEGFGYEFAGDGYGCKSCDHSGECPSCGGSGVSLAMTIK